ncbi:probable cardiolipin synthase (CMP-forming) [Bombus bifarius]|uniref:cardiolipin synthase (CMP-forming) n=1 Tax=Bombus bifarius TaxID=103933 RepID=A0A6P8M7C1_9HYME|nr:probable cardiolipin synthase (CMP-forming) [Bombus bifarius]XP_033303903.1 probable cardiolipin synthase (CMP-forming) [Bombus bifarius]
MNQFTILCFKQSTISSRYWFERCLRQYLVYHARVYSNGINNHKNYIVKKENISKKKALRLQILQDIKQTKRKVEVIIDKENIWTVPNILCMGRIVTSPYLSYLILSQDYQIALWLLIIAGFSDLADGWIARTWTSQASKLGTFLDPAADKLLVGTLFLSLAWVGLVPIPLTCLVIARDVALVSAVSYIRYQSLPPPKTLARYFDPTYATVQLAPTYISKINTAIQLSFVAGTLAAPIFHFVNHPALEIFCYVTAVTTLAGGVSYLISKNTYKFVRKKTSTKSSN